MSQNLRNRSRGAPQDVVDRRRQRAGRLRVAFLAGMGVVAASAVLICLSLFGVPTVLNLLLMTPPHTYGSTSTPSPSSPSSPFIPVPLPTPTGSGSPAASAPPTPGSTVERQAGGTATPVPHESSAPSSSPAPGSDPTATPSASPSAPGNSGSAPGHGGTPPGKTPTPHP